MAVGVLPLVREPFALMSGPVSRVRYGSVTRTLVLVFCAALVSMTSFGFLMALLGVGLFLIPVVCLVVSTFALGMLYSLVGDPS